MLQSFAVMFAQYNVQCKTVQLPNLIFPKHLYQACITRCSSKAVATQIYTTCRGPHAFAVVATNVTAKRFEPFEIVEK